MEGRKFLPLPLPLPLPSKNPGGLLYPCHSLADHSLNAHSNYKLKYIAHVDSTLSLKYPIKDAFVHLCVPLTIIVPHIPITEILKITKFHKITLSHDERLDQQKLVNHFVNHSCINCNLYKSAFSVVYD